MSALDARVAATAAAQHGLISYHQLVRAGATPSSIHRRVRSGRFERCLPRTYAVTGFPWTWRRRLCAIWLSLGPEAMVSHRAAARLLGVYDTVGDPPLEVTVPRGQARGLPRRAPHDDGVAPRVIVHESLDLHRAESIECDGMAVTAPSRLAVDLGGVIDFDKYRFAVTRLRDDHGLDWSTLANVYFSHSIQGRTGCGALRNLIERYVGETDAPEQFIEQRCADLLEAGGLSRPMHQFELPGAGGSIRFDLAYPGHRIAIEVEGAIHRRPDVHQRDHVRRNRALVSGWTVLHFTWHDVMHRPGYVLATVRDALALATSAS